ncbi:hypothetical protein CASFOL_028378 [Castilleja foliolosa]|uniref:Transposase n=1 Tax=Castilleja foliolosa TaxID=1961234 RepID=A0ABD3CAZ8_9LAMI
MNREWVLANRLTQEYRNGVDYFIKFATENSRSTRSILCPCKNCRNLTRLSVDEVKGHMIMFGIDPTYTRWIWHGEKEHSNINLDELYKSQQYEGDRLEEMAHAAQENFSDHPSMFEELLRDAREPLYPSCTKYTKLSTILKLYNLKAAHGWTDRSFTALLDIMKDILPENNVLPNRTYDAKKVISSLAIDYERIHACPNDCVLYRNEYESLDCCPNPSCRQPRYQRAGVAAKVVWYFPIIPRFKRMFSNTSEAKNLRWHAEGREVDGNIRHPADSEQWISIDNLYPDFSKDPRNLRLALSADGMNPYGSQSSTHSTWPVVLVIYNLPSSLCMKRKYMMLSLLISGPKQPGNDIDVYLQPIVEDLKVMWDSGVEVYDAHLAETFSLRAMLLWTINDFPAYGNLSGYSTKGHEACPICQKDTAYCQLKNCQKTVYLGSRRFLPMDHRYRKLRKAFNGQPEEGTAPTSLSGQETHDVVSSLNITYGKKRDKPLPTKGWKKNSIFFSLSYWKDLPVRHCLDVMHIEKNICESLLGTLLNVRGKTKDGINARLDMVDMGIRTELKPEKVGNRTYLPPACYTLSKKEKLQFCNFFKGIKVPAGFSSNVKSLVNLSELKLQGMKSHDCHIVMQELLPIAIRGILPKHVRNAITRLCFFFKKICCKVIIKEELDKLQEEIVVTLCQLEMYFPPSFFDIMVHLSIHLVREIRYCGPVYLRWMYPFERYMKVFKGYVKNRYRPEACIVERYIVEEAIEFCNEYLSGVTTIGLPKRRKTERDEGKGTFGGQLEKISSVMRCQAHLYVIRNTNEVEKYVQEHMSLLGSRYSSRKTQKWIIDEHNRSFSVWLRARVLDQIQKSPGSVSTTLTWLSQEPLFEVKSFAAYEINGVTFYTKEQDDKSTTQNSGVMLVAETAHVSSAKDNNPVYEDTTYYGVIEHIWELDYTNFKVPVFHCRWANSSTGVKRDELGFVQVDLDRVGYKGDAFILASQAKQVFYVPDPSNNKWSVVLTAKEKQHDDYNHFSDELLNPTLNMPSTEVDVREDEVYLRDDHEEGIWANEDISSLEQVNKQRRSKRKRKV